MSVAFLREDSAETAQDITLPERPISPYPNFVTEAGLRALERAEADARAVMEAARQIEDAHERRRAVEHAQRDFRYFGKRLRTAELKPAPRDPDVAAFGATVTIERDDQRRQTFRIVGEDEAEPREGSISYVSPLARAILGKRVGDVVNVGGREVEILAIA